MDDVRIDSDGVAHGLFKVRRNWWAQWCFTRNEDGAFKDHEVTRGFITCLRCLEAQRQFGRTFRDAGPD